MASHRQKLMLETHLREPWGNAGHWHSPCDCHHLQAEPRPIPSGFPCSMEMTMNYCVVTEPCCDCKYTDCVTVCPVDCFYQDELMLYIDPQECIDCGACIGECPVAAIFRDTDVPSKSESYVQLNAERSAALKTSGGHIAQRQTPQEGPRCKRR
jgi:ferredoxin